MTNQTLTKQDIGIKFSKKSIAKIILAIFIISLIPLIAVSFFNRQSADDFQYGNLTAHAWRETGSLYQVLLAALRQVESSYVIWQGTFTAIFLFALQPAIFSEHLYFLTTIIILFSFIGSTIYFLYVVFVHYIKADRWTWIIISLTCLFFCIQYAPSASDAFYWFNGGIYYIFFYSLFLILNGMVLDIPFYKSKKTVTFYTLVICFLSLFISGGNFTSALVACVTMLGFCILYFINKTNHRQVIYLSLFLLLLGLIISAIAPGNAVRSQALIAGGTYPTSFIKTIIDSFAHALRLIMEWTNVFFLSILILLTPLMWVNTKRCNFSFKYPVLVVIGSYCLFSAQLAPPLFAMSYIGESRQVNIYYFMYILLA
ncbi:MAG: hypothetical protein GX829_11260, partial [Clostridium sp.]|nr:hypothetical protein [Clostridium sp.]